MILPMEKVKNQTDIKNEVKKRANIAFTRCKELQNLSLSLSVPLTPNLIGFKTTRLSNRSGSNETCPHISQPVIYVAFITALRASSQAGALMVPFALDIGQATTSNLLTMSL